MLYVDSSAREKKDLYMFIYDGEIKKKKLPHTISVNEKYVIKDYSDQLYMIICDQVLQYPIYSITYEHI